MKSERILVEKQVVVSEPAIQLILSIEEADILYALVGKIGGGGDNEATLTINNTYNPIRYKPSEVRRVTSGIYDTLLKFEYKSKIQ